ncbi:hypothetical protein GC093_04465 [Paenibacillus sp. LMG 31456]|uniref:Uncharacterized protein n=1 Tax=Paenibacillus foliorum TaxID=2654974 RepID=A0A972GQF0_9BACL|nr:hypothetical protein [Paenibacillus foliorum]NOU92489.1 hypothetical protein [Paenibacillus foliorum]
MMAELAARIINDGVSDVILEKRRAYSREQNLIVSQYLGDYKVNGAPECIFRWLVLPDDTTGKAFELRAYHAGVQVYMPQNVLQWVQQNLRAP